MPKPTLEDAINYAAGELPEGATVRIEIENGAASIIAEFMGEGIDIDPADRPLSEQVIEAVEWAVREAAA